MIAATWTVLSALAVLSILLGRIDVALLLAGTKALLVGRLFMDLRHAAAAHAALWIVWVLLVTAILGLVA